MLNYDLILYPPNLYLAERELAFFLTKILAAKVPAIEPLTTGLKHKQPVAVVNSCTQSLSILTGPPGTGKTTTLKMIVESFLKVGLKILIVSPTGKAAKRANEVVNSGRSFVSSIPCRTVHSALEYDAQSGGFVYNRFHYLPFDVVIMDEFSMADVELMRDFLEAIRPGKTRVVLCGDQYQLPSVGPGNVSRDLISIRQIPQVELDVVLRTGENSGITYNANRILRGQDISKQDNEGTLFTDFFFVGRESEEETVKSIIKWVKEDLPGKRGFNSIRDIQVMTPGKNGIVGRKNLNKVLRDALNPPQINAAGKAVGGFRVGDKVINTKNDKKLYLVNGDMGFVKEVVNGQGGTHLTIDFGPNTGPDLTGMVSFKGDMLERIQFAFAQTVHKSQGSEFPVEILPIHACHTRLLTRNLVYTGLTRGKQLGMLVGSLQVFGKAVRNTVSQRRQTGLVEAIRDELKSIMN